VGVRGVRLSKERGMESFACVCVRVGEWGLASDLATRARPCGAMCAGRGLCKEREG